jgi:plasmid segregation protein ParM
LIIGVDVGYRTTKVYTGEGSDIFGSTVQQGRIDLNRDSIVIGCQGRELTIGERGAYSVDLNKIEDDTFRFCLYTAIVRAMKYSIEEVYLVTGLPISYYSKQKAALREALEGKDVFISYKGVNKVFTISKCLVFPQSAGLMILEPEKFKGDTLVIDIGGMTVDVSYFEGMKLVKYATYPNGMLKLYGRLAQELMARYSVSLDLLDIERKLREGFVLDDEQINIDADEIMAAHSEDILRPIKLDFPYRTSRKAFIGGGSVDLKAYLPGNVEINEDSIFKNARAFYQVGVEKFGGC